jgi:hypothetical protein
MYDREAANVPGMQVDLAHEIAGDIGAAIASDNERNFIPNTLDVDPGVDSYRQGRWIVNEAGNVGGN